MNECSALIFSSAVAMVGFAVTGLLAFVVEYLLVHFVRSHFSAATMNETLG